ncbi:MAG TPA: hypothetical protein VHL59_19205 [Thermoanaerobaculia bacterium]|nr:hypothetical protein [Thermoanaerobaculia bacterium]
MSVAAAVAPSILTGTWHNTNARGRVSRITIDGDTIETPEWGRAAARLYGESLCSDEASAFSARFTRDDVDVRLQANIKGGVLVVAYFTRFLDASGGSPYFCREFYWREVKR